MHSAASPTRGADLEPCPLVWTSASCSHPGRVREINEDACLDEPARGLWAVADGMGGHALGEFASRLAIRELMALPAPAGLEPYVADAEACLQRTNQRLRDEAARRDVPVIGTTIAVLLAWGRRCAFVWAGDSRIYRCRAGRLEQLSRDHSHAEAARARQRANPDETLHRPPSNLITRALGAAATLELDVGIVEVLDDDLFVLCSDGLSNEVHEPAIAHALLPGHCRQAARALLEMALQRGGRDNVTVVVVRAEDPESPDRTVIHPRG